jgi:hypothetical protein
MNPQTGNFALVLAAKVGTFIAGGTLVDSQDFDVDAGMNARETFAAAAGAMRENSCLMGAAA